MFLCLVYFFVYAVAQSQSKDLQVAIGKNYAMERSSVGHSTVTESDRALLSDNATIIGGSIATAGRYPFHVYIPKCCGGALIRHDLVLTAAHCLSCSLRAGHLYVGGMQRYGGTMHGIIGYSKHPAYNTTSHENDIAVLKLNVSSSVAPVKLNFDAKVPAVGAVTVTPGFGILKWENRSDPPPMDLYEVNLTIISKRSCSNRYEVKSLKVYAKSMLCASAKTNNVGTCFGDSGSPLLLMNRGNNDMIQIGINSWGIVPCGMAFFPEVFTRLSTYRTFIRNAIRDLGSNVTSSNNIWNS